LKLRLNPEQQEPLVEAIQQYKGKGAEKLDVVLKQLKGQRWD